LLGFCYAVCFRFATLFASLGPLLSKLGNRYALQFEPLVGQAAVGQDDEP
jgi:hypothetical protein